MNILHIVEDYSINSGGLRTVIKNLNHYLNESGNYSYVLASKKDQEDDIFIVETANKYLYSNQWEPKISQIVAEKNINVIHIHGVWLYPQYIGAKWAIKNNIPMVLSPHGMYQPWIWKTGTLKKKLYFHFITKKWFSKASVIHTITQDETFNTMPLFTNNKFIEIPNLISLPDNKNSIDIRKKYILSLGRLHKTKGIDVLIKAFSEIENKSIVLKIAGGFNNYKLELDILVKELNLSQRVQFLGMIKNQEKELLIKNAWVMVSPTYTEVIGMVNLESASLKTPMITTYNTGLKKEWNQNGGKLINPDKEELKIALAEVLNWTVDERNEMGKQLFQFVEKHYSWKTRVKDWTILYKNL
jgi:glycosyltransferase involved in cell wall biosynthesis